MILNQNLTELGKQEGAARWLDSLPQLLAELTAEWRLELAQPYPTSTVSYTVAASQGDTPVVLKIQWPHRECEYEADALKVWNGRGAVRLLDHDSKRNALLLERCTPGTHLSQSDESDKIGVVVRLLPKLWQTSAVSFQTLKDEAQRWFDGMTDQWCVFGKPCERRLIDAALNYLEELAGSQGEQVVIHQDLHGENILAAARDDGWLAIDPKPLLGEREFSLSPVIRSFELGDRRRDVLYRLDRISDELGLNRQRSIGWTVAQTVAWSFGSRYSDRHYETARWLLDA